MTLYAYDGASPFSLTDAKAHGAVLITGYIVGHPGGYDPIDKKRIQQIRALGLGFLPNWERGASFLVSCGYSGGVGAGREAVTALEALGVPHGTAVVFSWDTHVDPADYSRVGKVADGIIDGLAGKYVFSAYGQGDLLAYLRTTGRMKVKGWLSASKSFPGYDEASPHVGLVQKIGTPVPGTDQDVVTDPYNLGAWWPDGSLFARKELKLDADVKARFDKLDAEVADLKHALLSALSSSDGKPHYLRTWLSKVTGKTVDITGP